MFISATFSILPFRTLPFIPQKIRKEFFANYPLTTFRIPQNTPSPVTGSQRRSQTPVLPLRAKWHRHYVCAVAHSSSDYSAIHYVLPSGFVDDLMFSHDRA